MIAEVMINSKARNLNKKFDYKIPDYLQDIITVGSRVLVPFANFKKLEEGYVIKIKENTDFEVKEIAGLEDNISAEKIELARWMARKYFCNVSECIKLMLPPGQRNKNIENRVTEKKTNFVYLNIDENNANEIIENLRGEKQKKALKFIIKNPGFTITEIMKLTEVSRETINLLIKKEIIKIEEKRIQRDPLANKKIAKNLNLKLTDEQQYAYNQISNAINQEEFKEFLIYGVTGSGKTEVYMQLIEKVLNKNKKAIMLVPEISLTPQMIDRFIGRFGKERLAVLHSKLSIGERYDEWTKIQEDKADIIIGARSAIFAPINNLGIIIIDEEHDSSYKSDSTPRYDAKEVARKIAKDYNSVLVLGSATPDVSTFYKTENNEIQLLKLTTRANKSELPKVKIVDLKMELATGNKSTISRDLYNAIEENLKNKNQTILFLNRRGYSTFIMCRECGYTLKCPNCDISLTYHSYANLLKCHYCGHTQKPTQNCPNCGSDKIRYFGTGTQKLETEVKKLFPEATTIRMDVDTVTKKNSHEQILNRFRDENIDILIGTQMVVKGHHFPNVTLVGVIAADGSLNIDDFRASERTFQILTQVAGRAGREKREGKVIIQTYNPDSYSIEFAQKQNYDLFYKTEIELRKQLKYPPFCDIILIGFTSTDEKEIVNVSNYTQKILKSNLEKYGVTVFPAIPAPIEKIQNKIRWRIIAKGKVTNDVIIIINKCLKNLYDMKNVRKTSIIVDVNPNNMM